MKEPDSLWVEREEIIEPKVDDNFVPAIEAKPFNPEKEELVVRIEL
jgi:hypothetical protein